MSDSQLIKKSEAAVNIEWNRKDIWTHRGNKFTVEISRHSEPAWAGEGENRWCVYAYVHKEHWLFGRFDGTENMFQSACDNIPMHGGPISSVTYLRYHRAESGVFCVQVGADYHHCDDRRFTWMDCKEEAKEVFSDAETLIDWLAAESIL